MTEAYGRRGYHEEPRKKRYSSFDERRSKEDEHSKRYRRGGGDYEVGHYGPGRSSWRTEHGNDRAHKQDFEQQDFDRRRDEEEYSSSHDWKCLECMTWNYPEDECCGRCGAFVPEGKVQNFGEVNDNRNEQEVDEFGRVIKTEETRKEAKKTPEWPPHFESNGSAFVFDTRSGMFYQAESDFFYDPKSKLYYGNKKSAYYRYVPNKSMPFEEVQIVDAEKHSSLSTDLEPEPALAPLPKLKVAKADANNKISIKLKTKSLKNKSEDKPKEPVSSKALETAPPASRLLKKHVADMDKWSDRQVEKRVEEREIQRTAKGEPMCSLCRRKFPTVEKLLHHEMVSKLHQENLALQKAKLQELPQSPVESGYVDRAQQRRAMYGPEAGVVVPLSLPVNSIHQDHNPTPPPEKEDLKSESNIGNQLLQKMGWKEGKCLGRQPDSSHAHLMKDWDRIEALASNGGRGSAYSGGGVGSQG